MALDDYLGGPENSEIPGLLEKGLAWLGLIEMDGRTALEFYQMLDDVRRHRN